MTPARHDDLNAVLAEAHALIAGLIEERLAPEETRRLEGLVCEHPAVCELYVSLMHQRCAMTALASRLVVDVHDPLHAQESLSGYRLEPVSGGSAEADDAAESPVSPTPFWRVSGQNVSGRRLSLGWVAGAAVAASMLLGLSITSVWYVFGRGSGNPRVARIQLAPTIVLPKVMGNVTASAGANWRAGCGPVGSGVVALDHLMVLKGGFVEITFLGGARVVVEGPARFVARSETSMALEAGRVSAYAPEQAAGFIVDTPRAHVKDLGTEFGVSVEADGNTLVHVYAGKVEANSASTATTRPSLLTAGDAANVSPVDVKVMPGKASPQVFVRRISTTMPTLDVVDLVSGGDGTTRRRDFAIDALTGVSGALPAVTHVKGDGAYHAVPGVPVVDGCFIPNGAAGAERVDSGGHRFQFPTTIGEGFNQVWAGGPVPWPEQYKPPFEGRVGGVDYSSPEHGLLLLHSNVGLTLDLAAIRRLHPGQRVVRFRAVAGNASRPDLMKARADVYVLVDGKSRFERRGFVNDEAPFVVDVPIRDSDRFLTLASTDGGDDNRFDWVTFGDPTFDLNSIPEDP